MLAHCITQEYIPRVLLVDDTPANLDVLVEHLAGENIEIMVATSGSEGLHLALTTKPDLVLLDVMMPGMDGYTMCSHMREDPMLIDIPVVFLTAKHAEQDIERGLELGAVDYIAKPFSMPILKARVRNHLALKRKGDQLAELACTDGLTHIANRRHFDQVLGQEWRRAERNNSELAIIMIDIDHFKEYNDALGHSAGDQCLRKVASTLKAALHRPGDMLARYGGEEFIVVLPETNLANATLIAEQMRLRINALTMLHPNSPSYDRLTVSLGVACAHPAQTKNETLVVEIADRNLYAAKRSGRNKVVS
ncbi:diguanylate cyclase [Gilvimarinus sp. SDUM040013]|uniref:diguanylate cyclase n=1 Tax=Gilvimarinus gilvus TaxID=3058038 RepID=A0ABU4RV25_9GAMM|nr:diguanylate cyclase [Gilvimarinus sp. SDUM040013]MDO3387898.1 diguanylate cyclase [Gilvimarinus sp. SDUM040013]MDX6848731.1 diguanylate cyclase [Gilvimarinus sp. SDUM040013]